MNLAVQIAAYREKGFTSEQAEVITLMRVAAGVLFRDFPDSFLLFGGATLLLFHNSVRHSADLDLQPRTDTLPTSEDLRASLATGLASAAEALNLGPLHVEVSGDKILVKQRDNSLLFKVDITRFGSVIESEVEEHTIEIDEGNVAKVKAASREFLLLQKAECFLLRKNMKTRDAFDIYGLRQSGVVLNEQLENHLEDTLMGDQIDAAEIAAKIAQVDEKRCGELRAVLSSEVFESLAKERFRALREALRDLYQRWL
jgi:Ca2+-binding EF-hand superfamily protein